MADSKNYCSRFYKTIAPGYPEIPRGLRIRPGIEFVTSTSSSEASSDKSLLEKSVPPSFVIVRGEAGVPEYRRGSRRTRISGEVGEVLLRGGDRTVEGGWKAYFVFRETV
ncbi:hypothetical protein L6452_08265 [Arctium lappa]|uniref:Uncharacterized protein n=1 Tax=Arctium lappa TaxID=4217 RepID=A0ACB9DGR7_ARCLA|nr:hypothetical protein L6452_08265 [Arctium lappa]